jgi:uncharacterized protein (DUF1330 family)
MCLPQTRSNITEWDSVEQAQGWRNSDTFRALAPLRDKAIRTIRAYVIEGL